jgi:chromosome segregation ATPase
MKIISEMFWDWVMNKTTVDEKAVATYKEIKKRYNLTTAELKDISKAIKEVGNQIGDVGGALKGNARKGRK